MPSQPKRATVRFYAELNDLLRAEHRYRDVPVEFHVPPAVKDVIESLGVPHTEVDLVLVNGEPAAFSQPVSDGDRVSVYPVFESLDIAAETRVRPAPLRETRFVLDAHLGRLARYLRLLGFDSLYERDAEDEWLARASRDQRRILLTRDGGLLKRSAVTHGYLVRQTDPRRQAAEVVERFDLYGSIRPSSRCTACNGELIEVEKAEIVKLIPDDTRRHYHDFQRCTSCGHVYWQGAHHARISELIEDLRRRRVTADAPQERL